MKPKRLHRTTVFLAWSDRMERRLKQALCLLAVLLLLGQTVLQFPAIRSWLNATDKWEGVPFERDSP